MKATAIAGIIDKAFELVTIWVKGGDARKMRSALNIAVKQKYWDIEIKTLRNKKGSINTGTDYQNVIVKIKKIEKKKFDYWEKFDTLIATS